MLTQQTTSEDSHVIITFQTQESLHLTILYLATGGMMRDSITLRKQNDSNIDQARLTHSPRLPQHEFSEESNVTRNYWHLATETPPVEILEGIKLG